MSNEESSFKTRNARALVECQASIDWYRKHKHMPRLLHQTSLVATVALSALTPVLILVTDLPKWAQALPAALAAIAATLDSLFHWREHWVRQASALEALEAELVRFETRTSTYGQHLSDEEALSSFVERITNIDLTEVSNWATTQVKKSPKANQA